MCNLQVLKRNLGFAFAMLSLLAVSCSSRAVAADDPPYKLAGGLAVYIGVVPAELIRHNMPRKRCTAERQKALTNTMLAINFIIDSDFKWVLLGMALIWACSLVCFGLRSIQDANDRIISV